MSTVSEDVKAAPCNASGVASRGQPEAIRELYSGQHAVDVRRVIGDAKGKVRRMRLGILRRVGLLAPPDQYIVFKSAAEAATQIPKLKRRLDFAEGFLRALLRQHPSTLRQQGFLRGVMAKIVDGVLERGEFEILKWLKQSANSEYVGCLKEHLTMHSLLPSQLSDEVEYREQLLKERMKCVDWSGICGEDQDVLNEFLRQKLCRNSIETVNQYRGLLAELMTLMRENRLFRLRDVQPHHCSLLVKQWGERGLSRMTVHSRIHNLKHFYRWLMEEKGYSRCPVLRRHVPRRSYSDPKPLTRRQVREIRATLDSRFIGTMARAFFYLIYLTGLRVTEALNVKLGDIDLEKPEVFVARGKGGKTGYVPISKYAIRRIDEWVSKDSSQKDRQYVFEVNGIQSGPSRTKILRGAIVAASGVTFTWQQLRVTYATRLAEYHVGPFEIQKLLRHSRLSTVMRYVNLEDSRVRESYNAFTEDLLSGRKDDESVCIGSAVNLLDAPAPTGR